MPSKKEKREQIFLGTKSQTLPVANSTNTSLRTNENLTLSNSFNNLPTNHLSATTATNSNNDSIGNLDHLSLIRGSKNELYELNNRFSNYVIALGKKRQENDDLQKIIDIEKQKQSKIF